MKSVLPLNATRFERVLEAASDYKVHPDILKGFKAHPPTAFREVLTEEYGLQELLTWVPSGSDVLKEGLLFQRIRGTPYALRLALKWIGLNGVIIEEEEPGPHFAEYQLGLDVIPSKGDIARIQALATLASPVRSRLKRIYNTSYDVRRFKLDQSIWGDLLSDHSGIIWKEDPSLTLSLGRKSTHSCSSPKPILHLAHLIHRFSYAKNEDIYRLDFAQLGESFPTIGKTQSTYLRHTYFYNSISVFSPNQTLAPRTTYAKAQIVLSESQPLGTSNACLGAITIIEEGSHFTLSQTQLSDHKWALFFTPLLERFYHITSSYVKYKGADNVKELMLREHFKILHHIFKENTFLSFTQTINQRARYRYAVYKGDISGWHGYFHVNRKWKERNTLVISLSHQMHGVEVKRFFNYPVLSQHARHRLLPVQASVLKVVALSFNRKQFLTIHYRISNLKPIMQHYRENRYLASYYVMSKPLSSGKRALFFSAERKSQLKQRSFIASRYYFTHLHYTGVIGWHAYTPFKHAWTKRGVIVNTGHKQETINTS